MRLNSRCIPQWIPSGDPSRWLPQVLSQVSPNGIDPHHTSPTKAANGRTVQFEQRETAKMKASSYRVSLRIRHSSMDPTIFTGVLGMVPKRFWKAGDRQTRRLR